jgi:putative PEP-CTERM system histidine kinase
MTLEAATASGLLTGLVAYTGLAGFFIYGWFKRITGRAALLASATTAAWFGSFLTLGMRPTADILEISAYTFWIILLTRILGVGIERLLDPLYRSQTVIAALAIAAYAFALAASALPSHFDAAAWPLQLKLFFCLLGIVSLEQVARNTRRDHAWNVKFLIIGLGAMFTYGFFLYADALLFHSKDFRLLAPQGYVYAIAAPLIAIASLRNRTHRMNVNLSRRFVFRTGTLLLAGGYLLIMGTAGYYVRFFGGEWGEVFQVFLVSAGLIGLALIAVSTQVRNALRSAIERNLYEYKYDYRDEWLRVTRELTHSNPDEGLSLRAIHALIDLLHAKSGAYWRLSNEGLLLPMTQLSGTWNGPVSPAGSQSLIRFFQRFNWIIDLDEYRSTPAAYGGLVLDHDLELLEGARFLVPLPIEDRLFGIVAVGQPMTPMNLIWEDYDILKIIARQSAGFLALHHADRVLSASKQLRAMDQLSAFVVHDLKTVSAQLGLLLQNAERHKTNPAFIDDMLKTTENAVRRMNKLVDQLRSKDEESTERELDLVTVIEQAVKDRSAQEPAPQLETLVASVSVRADAERLGSVVAHVIQNAQDATEPRGTVRVRIDATPVWAVVAVTDTGHGMSADFVDNELFAPFVTTRGVAGIGVGAYQCREYIRALGGDVSVRSRVGAGTEFTLRLPLVSANSTAAVA